MRVDNCTGKGTSGMDEFGNVTDRMNMKLGSNSLIIETQLLKRLKCVIVVGGATHSPIRMVWRVTEAPWSIVQRSLCCSCAGAQLVLRSSVLKVLDLDKCE